MISHLTWLQTQNSTPFPGQTTQLSSQTLPDHVTMNIAVNLPQEGGEPNCTHTVVQPMF